MTDATQAKLTLIHININRAAVGNHTQIEKIILGGAGITDRARN